MLIQIEAESIRELDEILARLQAKPAIKTGYDFGKNGYDFRKAEPAPAAPEVKPETPERKKYARVDVNDIYRLKKAGKTAKEIADELGCGYSTVCKKLNEVF